jgi:hypothetical protein
VSNFLFPTFVGLSDDFIAYYFLQALIKVNLKEKKMKKLLVVSLTAMMVGSAMSQSAFEGFYGQLGVGYESVAANSTNGTMIGGDASGSSYTITSGSSNSFIGNVGIGAYFPMTSSFLLGVGGEYSPFAGAGKGQTFSIPAVSFSSNSSWQKKNSYNIFLSPAYVVAKDKLAYVKVGYTGMSTTGNQTTTDYIGYSLGLGYKQMISGGLYTFGEVNYAGYNSKPLGSSLSGSGKPAAMNALVGVGYKF